VPPIDLSDKEVYKSSETEKTIDIKYLGDKRWQIIGIDYPIISLKSGEELLHARKFSMLRKTIDDEETLIRLARKVDNTLKMLKDRETIKKSKEKDEDESRPRWLENTELISSAEKYVQEGLREIMSLPESERVERYHEWLRNEVLKDLMAGEDDNKVCGFVIILFGDSYILLLPGKSSIGKNLLADTFLEMVPHYTTHRTTEHGIDYINPDEVSDKILYLKEVESFEGHSSFVLKGLEDHKEGQGIIYSISYPVRDDKTGRITTITQKMRLKAFISTTNIEHIATPGLEERMFIIKLDDSPEQNERVIKYLDRDNIQEDEVKIGVRRWTDREWSIALTYCLWKTLNNINEEILIPYDNLAEVVLKSLVSDTEVRRHARRLRQFVKWFGRAFGLFLPIYEINGKKFRIVTIDVLKLAIRYFYHLIGAKQEFKKPYLLKFAEKLLDKYRDSIDVNVPMIEFGKVARQKLARELGYTYITVNSYFEGLLSELPQAVIKNKVGKEVIYRVDMIQLMSWVSEYVSYTPLSLNQEQVDELAKSLNNWIQNHASLIIPSPDGRFFIKSKTEGEGVFPSELFENSIKPTFIEFYRFSDENTEGKTRIDIIKNQGADDVIIKEREDREKLIKKEMVKSRVLEVLRQYGSMHIRKLAEVSQTSTVIIRLMEAEGLVQIDEYTDKVFLRGDSNEAN